MSQLSDDYLQVAIRRLMRIITTLSNMNPTTLTDAQRAVRLTVLAQAIALCEPLVSEQIDREIMVLTRTPATDQAGVFH